MAGVGGKIKIQVDLQEIERLKKEIADVKKQILNLSGSDVQKYLDGLNQKYQDLNKQLQAAGEEAMKMARDIDSLNEKYNQQKSTIEQYENQIISLTEQLKNSSKSVSSPEYQELEKDLHKIESAYEKATQEAENMQQAISQKMGITGNIDKFFDGVEKNADNFVDAINRQREAIKKMELDYISTREKMTELGKRKNYSPENMAEYEKLKKLMVEIRGDMSLEKKDLSALEKAYKQFIDSRLSGSQKEITLLTQRKQILNEMGKLELAGKSGTDEYKQLEQQLSKVGTAINIVNKNAKALTTAGSAHLAGIIQGITGLSGAFSAGQGVMSLFVKDNEKLAAIQTKLQAAMAITIGLQQVSNTLHATSSFRINTVTKITQLWSNAQKALNTSIGLSTGLSKAFLSGGIMLLAAGIIYLITQYKEWNKQQNELKIQLSKARASIQEQVVRVKILDEVLKNNNKSYSERNNALKQLKDIMPGYNAYLSKEGKLIEDNTGALQKYVKELLNVEMAKKTIAKLADAQTKLDEFNDSLTEGDKLLLNPTKELQEKWDKYGAQDSDRVKRLKKEQAELQTEVDKLSDIAKEYIASDATIYEDFTKGYWEAQQKNAQARLYAMKDFQKGSEEWNHVLAEYNQATIKLKAWDVKPKTDKEIESAANKAESLAQKMRDAQLKLLNLQAELDSESIKQQLDHEQKLLDIEQDSFDKRYRQNQLNTAKEFVAIEEYRQKMAKAQQDAAKSIYVSKNGTEKGFDYASFDKSLLPDGLKDSDIEAQIDQMTKAIIAGYKKGNEDLVKEQQSFRNEENLTFASQLDQQIYSIRKNYEQRRIEAKNNAEDIKLINDNENREITSARLQAQQRQLESDADYNQKYIQLVTDRYVFEADKRKAALQQQIKDQEDWIKNKEKELLNDPNNDELANQLKAAKLELKLFNKELEKTSADKFTEIASGISDVASTLRSALEDFGVSFSDSANQVMDGGMQILDGAGKMSKGIKDMDVSSFIQGMITQTQGYFNLIGGMFGPDGTAYYEGVKTQLEAINNIYASIIQKSKEEIVFGGGFASINAASTALDNYYKKVANLQKIADASGRSGAKWNSHSAEWHSNKNVGASNFSQMSTIVGQSIKSMDDLYYLTGDQLYLLQTQMPEAWSKIDSRILENLQSIIDCKDEALELKDALNEALTGVSQDAFYNDFINNLSNMETSFEDMCDNFEDSLRKSIIAGLVADQYKDRIGSLYQQWSAAAKSDGEITESEADQLKEEYQKIVKDMWKDREDLANSFGWDTSSSTSQSTTKGGFETMTQDQAGEMNGRLTGIMETNLRSEGYLKTISEWNQPIGDRIDLSSIAMPLNLINESSSRIEQMIEENKSIAINSYYELKDINKNTKELYQMNKRLGNIEKNTKGLAPK